MRSLEASNGSSTGDKYLPSSTTLLVSLFLIMLCFFIMLTKDLDLSQKNRADAIRSIHKTFGLPEKDGINFGGILKPQHDNYILEIEDLFREYADIETTSNGGMVRIEIPKNFLFYNDEAGFKPEKTDLIINLAGILKRWKERDNPMVTVLTGMEDYGLDKQRLKSFSSIAGFPLDIGGSEQIGSSFIIIVEHDYE